MGQRTPKKGGRQSTKNAKNNEKISNQAKEELQKKGAVTHGQGRERQKKKNKNLWEHSCKVTD